MPNDREHIQWSLHNIDVISYLSKEPCFCDWTATVSFYTALHIIEAVFYRTSTSDRSKHGVCHENRMKLLKQTHQFEKIYRHYRILYSTSRIARYIQNSEGSSIYFPKYMPHEKVISCLVQHELRHIMLSVAKLNVLGNELSAELTNSVGKLPSLSKVKA